MRLAAAILAMLAGCATTSPGPSEPVYAYSGKGVDMRLMPTPCADPRVMQMLTAGMPQKAAQFMAIESRWVYSNGSAKDLAGCWIELSKEEVGEVSIFLIFEDGDYFLVPKATFLGQKKSTRREA